MLDRALSVLVDAHDDGVRVVLGARRCHHRDPTHCMQLRFAFGFQDLSARRNVSW